MNLYIIDSGHSVFGPNDVLALTRELSENWDFNRLIYPSLVDYDGLFISATDKTVIPCGMVPKLTEERATQGIELIFKNIKPKAQNFAESVFQNGSKDLNFISSCKCGHLTGNFYEGMRCPECGTVCTTNFASELKFRAWLELPMIKVGDPNDPKFIPPLLHPAMYAILNQWLGTAKVDPKDKTSPRVSILDSLLDPESPFPKQLENDGLSQGYQYFYKNFDDIINYFYTTYKDLQKKQKKSRFFYIPQLVAMYRDIIFFRHIPILNQSLHVITTSGTLKLTDNASDFVMKAYIDLSDFIYQYNNLNVKPLFINCKLWTIYKSVLGYTNYIAKTNLFGKTGHVRKNVVGSRVYCSGRAVITPISGQHSHDELYLPWKIGVELLKLEIINVLVNRMNYRVPDAVAKHAKAVVSYDADIDNIMKTLIAECREKVEVYVPHMNIKIHPKGLPALFGRNPTLRHGAIMMYFVTVIKNDLDDDTISVSSRCATGPNFDFDGDAMHLLMIKEMDMIPTLMKLHPSMVMLGGPKIGLSGDIAITKQEAINLTAWLDEEQEFLAAHKK